MRPLCSLWIVNYDIQNSFERTIRPRVGLGIIAGYDATEYRGFNPYIGLKCIGRSSQTSGYVRVGLGGLGCFRLVSIVAGGLDIMHAVSAWILLIVESLEDHIGVWDSAMMRQLSDLSLKTRI